MTTRPTMTHLIQTVRDFCALPADAPPDHPDYLADADLQARIEQHSTLVIRQALYPIGAFADGEMVYTRYPIPPIHRWLEGVGEGSAWQLVDGTGADAPTHTYDPHLRMVMFEAPTDGRTYYLTATSYDLHAVAHTLWMHKAATSAGRVNFSVDGQSVSAGDYHQHCLAMARYFQMVDGASLSRRIRLDEVK